MGVGDEGGGEGAMEAEDGKTASVAAAAAGRNPEVWGYMLLRIAQAAGVVFISVQFQPALLTTAECISDEDGQLWNWLNFDSLIPGILMIAGITSALLTPAIGAACDYTTLRKPLLLGASFVQFGATVLGVVLAPNDTGVAISLLALFIFNVCYAMLLTGQSTWLPELTTSHDELARINRNGYTTLYIAEVRALGALSSFAAPTSRWLTLALARSPPPPPRSLAHTHRPLRARRSCS